jgi:hypothetical protein
MDGLTVAVLLSVVMFISGNYKSIIHPKFDIFKYTVPEAAADFVEKNRLPGNIFNDYGYGGYLTWRLYPGKKNFIDSRSLNLRVMKEYSMIMEAEGPKISMGNEALWELLLRAYKINIVFLSLFDVYERVPELVFKLSESAGWTPVYCDEASVIFIRNNAQNSSVIGKFRISSETVYNTLIRRSIQIAITNPVNKNSFISLGETFYRMGRLKDALAAYKYAFQRLPSSELQEKINKLESEMKSVEGQR